MLKTYWDIKLSISNIMSPEQRDSLYDISLGQCLLNITLSLVLPELLLMAFFGNSWEIPSNNCNKKVFYLTLACSWYQSEARDIWLDVMWGLG